MGRYQIYHPINSHSRTFMLWLFLPARMFFVCGIYSWTIIMTPSYCNKKLAYFNVTDQPQCLCGHSSAILIMSRLMDAPIINGNRAALLLMDLLTKFSMVKGCFWKEMGLIHFFDVVEYYKLVSLYMVITILTGFLLEITVNCNLIFQLPAVRIYDFFVDFQAYDCPYRSTVPVQDMCKIDYYS